MANQKRYDVDFKLQVVKSYQESDKTQPEICKEYGISRSSLCKWVREYKEKGVEGLQNKKPVPVNPARKTAKNVIDKIVGLKQLQEHKYQGLRAFSDYLKRFQGIALSITTLDKIFKKKGVPSGEENYQEQRAIVNPKKQEMIEKNVLKEISQWERFERKEPQELWQIDICQFYIKDEGRVYLVDIIDDYSRFLVGWDLFRDQKAQNVIKVFKEAVDRYGPPKEILSDNGRQFVSWHGITEFQELLEKLKVKHIKAKPHRPRTLGKLERWHGTLKKELVDVKFFHSLAEARDEIRKYVEYYNYYRTHSALEGLVPADRFYGVDSQVKELVQNGKEARLYLTGKFFGKDLRIQETTGRIDVYLDKELVKSVDFS